MKETIKSHEEMEKFAKNFSVKIKPEKDKAKIIGLRGDLGSGKTTFTKALAKAFNIKETLTSPTFVIEKKYKINSHENFDKLIHIDAYRLKSGKELKALDFDDISADNKNLILIEWPELVEDILPDNIEILNFTFIDDETREINYDSQS